MRQKFNLYPSSSSTLFRYYMETRRSCWEEDNQITAKIVSATDLKKQNNLLKSIIWSTKYHKYAQILALVGVTEKLLAEKIIQQKRQTRETRNPDHLPKESQHKPRTSSIGLFTRPISVRDTRLLMGRNASGSQNTALEKCSGPGTIQWITEIGLKTC